MTTEQKQALRITIDMIDSLMQESPNRQIADCANLLENMYQENK